MQIIDTVNKFGIDVIDNDDNYLIKIDKDLDVKSVEYGLGLLVKYYVRNAPIPYKGRIPTSMTHLILPSTKYVYENPFKIKKDITSGYFTFDHAPLRKYTYGYIVAPAIKLDIPFGRDIAFMLLNKNEPNIVTDNELIIDDYDINIKLTINRSKGIEIDGYADIKDEKFKSLRLELSRRSKIDNVINRVVENRAISTLLNYSLGVINIHDLVDIIYRTEDSNAKIHAKWEPTILDDDYLLIFYTTKINSIIDRLVNIFSKRSIKHDSSFIDEMINVRELKDGLVISDGPFIDYSLRVVIDKRFARDINYETYLELK